MTAIIDIGSNSVRLMLWADGKTLYKRVNTTRLGEGLSFAPVLRPEAIARTARAVSDFAREARGQGADVYAFATAAVRSAENGGEFLSQVKRLCGLDVDVVSGKEEALLGLFGALGAAEGGILDIGGASTEFCVRRGGKIAFSVSLDIGAVRLFDKCGQDRGALLAEIAPAIRPLGEAVPAGKIYAIGGTGSTLASVMLGLKEYDAEKINDFPMPEEQIGALSERLLSMSPEKRKEIPGMDPRRADIIAGGALLLHEIMKALSLPVVYASDRDNLEGYLLWRRLI